MLFRGEVEKIAVSIDTASQVVMEPIGDLD
jgi:hypothetical protein